MNKKQDVRDKVREIKQRQQNWLKQREESQQASPEKGSVHPVKSVYPKPKEVSNTQQSVPKNHRPSEANSPSLAQSLISSNKSKAKFQSWLKNKETHYDHEVQDSQLRNKSKGDSNYNSNKYTDNYYTDEPYRDHKGSGSVNVLRVPSSRSPQFATPDPGWNSDDETGEITAAELLSPDNFDARADDIIARVKGDLALTETNYTRRSHVDHRKTSSKSTYYESEVPEEQELSSHVCPTCEKLMMPPNASPMLLIPCGHTLCNMCSKKTKSCAMCGCVVQSSTLNIMLQQIITNFHTKQTHRQAAYKTVQKSNYQEEYQNLVTRREILQEESENISKNIQKVSRKLNRDEEQVAKIQKKEADVIAEIEALQRKLKELSEHRLEYEKNCYSLEVNIKEEKNRLILVRDTLSSVEQQIEKVNILTDNGF